MGRADSDAEVRKYSPAPCIQLLGRAELRPLWGGYPIQASRKATPLQRDWNSQLPVVDPLNVATCSVRVNSITLFKKRNISQQKSHRRRLPLRECHLANALEIARTTPITMRTIPPTRGSIPYLSRYSWFFKAFLLMGILPTPMRASKMPIEAVIPLSSIFTSYFV